MKFIENIEDLKIINWYKFQKSISNKKPDYRFLLKDKTSLFLKKEGEKAYINLISQFKNVNFKSLKNFAIFKAECLKYLLQKELYKYKKNEKPNLDNVINSFSDYFKNINDNYQGFYINEFFFNNDYQKKWLQIYDAEIPEFIKKLKDIKFYIFDEYIEFVDKYEPEQKKFLLNSVFFRNFIQAREVEIESLNILDKHLLNFYKSINQVEKYFLKRLEIFDINHIKFKINNNLPDILDEVTVLQGITGINIDIEKDSILMLEKIGKFAKEKIKAEKSNKTK